MVKKIPHEQSRRNAARRRRKVAARHARAGHCRAQPKPMLHSGTVSYEIGGNVDATCFGGIAAVHRLVTKLGLAERINDSLALLKVHLPYHESDHVLNLAYIVACGGTRLEDIQQLRHDTAYMNALGADLIPDPTTAGDFCRRFAEDDVVALMEAINAVRPQLWTGRGRDLLGPIAYLDVDGTIVPTSGERKAGRKDPRRPAGRRRAWKPRRTAEGDRRGRRAVRPRAPRQGHPDARHREEADHQDRQEHRPTSLSRLALPRPRG